MGSDSEILDFNGRKMFSANFNRGGDRTNRCWQRAQHMSVIWLDTKLSRPKTCQILLTSFEELCAVMRHNNSPAGGFNLCCTLLATNEKLLQR